MNMSALNITIDFSCLVVLITLIISQIFRRTKDSQNTLFLFVLVITAVTIGGELLAWVCEGSADPFMYFMQYAGNFAAYIAGSLIYSLLLIYFTKELNGRREFSKDETVLFIISLLLGAVVIVLALTNSATGILFTIDGNYRWKGGPGAVLTDLTMFMQQIPLFVLVLRHRDVNLSLRRKIIIFGLLMMTAAVLDIVIIDIAFCYPVTVLELLLIYLNFLLVVEEQMETTQLQLANTRYELMVTKISPDFVLDLLKDIEEMCEEDPEEAQYAISELSEYLRGNIDKIDSSELIPFEKEEEHVEHLMRLVQILRPDVRFEKNFEIRNFQVPVHSLMTVVEQAAGSCLSHVSTKPYVSIHTFRDQDLNCIEVISPSRGEDVDYDQAFDVYNHICLQLTRIPGASLRLFADYGRNTHALLKYPSLESGGSHE